MDGIRDVCPTPIFLAKSHCISAIFAKPFGINFSLGRIDHLSNHIILLQSFCNFGLFFRIFGLKNISLLNTVLPTLPIFRQNLICRIIGKFVYAIIYLHSKVLQLFPYFQRRKNLFQSWLYCLSLQNRRGQACLKKKRDELQRISVFSNIAIVKRGKERK